MALTRAALREAGVTDEAKLDALMESHGATVELAKEKATAAAEKAAQKTIETLQAENETLKTAPSGDTEDWKAKYEAKVIELQEKEATHAAEKEATHIDGLVAELLKKGDGKSSLHEKAIPKALKSYDRSIVERDKGGNIKNADKVLEAFRAEWGDFWGDTVTVGAGVATPPKAEAAKPDYKAQLEAVRKSGNTQDAVRIKTEAAKEGVILI